MIAVWIPLTNDVPVAICNAHDVLRERCSNLECVHLFHLHHVANTCPATLCVHVRSQPDSIL